MTWTDLLGDRERQEIALAQTYAKDVHHGTDGHPRLMLISYLTALLDQMEGELAIAPMVVEPDEYEREARNRLIAAARQVAWRGTFEGDSYRCSAANGGELRAALSALDSLDEQRDREEQEQGEEDTHAI